GRHPGPGPRRRPAAAHGPHPPAGPPGGGLQAAPADAARREGQPAGGQHGRGGGERAGGGLLRAAGLAGAGGLPRGRVPAAARGPGGGLHERHTGGGAMKSLGILAWLDDGLNPIVVKELRQAVRSRFVVAVLLLFLLLQVLYIGVYLVAG